MSQPLDPISHEIWDMKYRARDGAGKALDATVDDTWRRVAGALAAVEKPAQRRRWAERFHHAMAGYHFLPAGRILAGAGLERRVTLFNCFVMGQLDDSIDGIFDGLRESALTMQMGGGIGIDFSTLRPKGAPVEGVGADASGPLSFMDVWDAMCRTIMSAGSRRGAMMATMRCDHPDIEDFIAAKADSHRLRMFNLSVLVTDAFMAAVKADEEWPLVFAGKTHRTVRAGHLWERIMRATYDYAEPGVIFIDRINAANNLAYIETIHATNPCGEQPLPPHGACLLGSINLASLVERPFSPTADIDTARLEQLTATAVRMLDNAIDISRYPLPAQADEARNKRRIGLGVTGLADALVMCGLRYGDQASCARAGGWMKVIEEAAYAASIDLAREKGAFALFDKARYGKSGHVATLPAGLRRAIARHGIRNGLLTSIAPTGTISLFAGNVSSGIEPIFALRYQRKVLMPDGARRTETVVDHAVRAWWQMKGDDTPLPDSFVTTAELSPADHLAMQAALQAHVDSSISKTVNCPEDIPFAAFKEIYLDAYARGLKGCTTYRPNPVTGSVLSELSAAGDSAEPQTSPAQAALPLAAPAAGDGDVVYMQKPFERDRVLAGYTYKLKWPDSDHAIYITINDIIQNDRRRPFEIFINSKNMEHYAWTVALTRMISAVFRRGGDVSFVVEELKAVFDPRGGQWMNGKYVPSLLAAIGGIIERHMIDIGFLTAPEGLAGNDRRTRRAVAEAGASRPAPQCPKCAEPALMFAEGCARCMACDYSKCG